MDNRKKIRTIYSLLLKNYGHQGWWPILIGEAADGDFQRLEICLGAILTQNTNWQNVTTALKSLADRGLFSVERLLKTPAEEIAFAIKSAGYYNQKTRYLKNLAAFLKERPFQELEKQSKDSVRRDLLKVKGIGPETADCILLYALGKPSFVVDAYTLRMLSRLNIIEDGAGYRSVQKLFESALPRDADVFKEYHALIVRHAKEFYSKRSRDDDRLLSVLR